VKVIFVNQPPVADNPQGQLLLGVQGLFSEYECAVIADRMRRGRLHRFRQGQSWSIQSRLMAVATFS
jgi:site-specific DNA recombinase